MRWRRTGGRRNPTRRPPNAGTASVVAASADGAEGPLRSEDVAEGDLEVGAVDRARFDLEKEAAAMLGAEQDIEAPLGVAVAIPLVDVQRRAGAPVEMPAAAGFRKVIRELEVQRRGRHVVADAELDVRTE